MMSSTVAKKWLFRLRPENDAKLRLFLLPHAGGSATSFRSWAEHLPAGVDACALQLPGRGERLNEPAIESMMPLVEAVYTNIAPLLETPYVLFGHSFGALLAFELAHRIRGEGQRPPLRLVVSGRRAPSTGVGGRVLHLLPDEQVEARIRRFGGTPSVLLDDPELRALFIGVLRADFKVIETYEYVRRPPLDVPLSIFRGQEDEEAPLDLVLPWQQEAREASSLRSFAGGHFFALERPRPVVRALLDDVAFAGLEVTSAPALGT